MPHFQDLSLALDTARLMIDAAILGMMLVLQTLLIRKQLFALATGLTIACFISWLSYRWHDGFANHFDQYYGTRMFSEFEGEPAHSIVVLDDRIYAFFGSYRQHKVIQPRHYKGIPKLVETLKTNDTKLVAAREENTYVVYRYEDANIELEKSKDFEPLTPGRQLRLYRYRNDTPVPTVGTSRPK